jgi:hypothetical protein
MNNKLTGPINNQTGAAHFLLLGVAVLGVLAFIWVSSTTPFQNQLFSYLFPKPSSYAAGSFLETFDGVPSAPEPFTQLNQNNWDVSVHSNGEFLKLSDTPAHHGTGCEPPVDANLNLVTHNTNTFEDAVFKCNGHVMTALNAGGYSLAYLTPNHMIDFSTGEAVLRWDMATLRTSGRDWMDVWLTPYEDNLVYPLEDWLPIQNGYPKRAIHIRMDNSNGSVFRVLKVDNFAASELASCTWCPYESVMTTSPKQRSTFELRISRTHIKLSMPGGQLDVNGKPINGGQEFVWSNTNMPDLGWDKAIVQIGHHSYNPTKDCTVDPTKPAGYTCSPDTWHWDNVSISNAQPFNMIKANKRYVYTDWQTPANNPVVFNSPAPENAYLRFSAVGNVEYSLDNGSTWQAATRQKASREVIQGGHKPEHSSGYFIPVPQGTQTVSFRFSQDGWYGGPFIAQDFAIWSLTPGASTPLPTPLPTPTPVVTPLPTPTPVVTPLPTPTPVPTPLPTPTPVVTPAPTPTPAPTSNILEGELMSLLANSGALQVFNDSLASGGRGMVYFSNATSTGSLTTGTNTNQIVVRARGDNCQGNPHMVVRVDGVIVLSTNVSGSTYSDFVASRFISPGTHNLSITFDNDHFRTNNKGVVTCDRNLRVDKVTLQ